MAPQLFHIEDGDLLEAVLHHCMEVERADSLLFSLRPAIDEKGRASFPLGLESFVEARFKKSIVKRLTTSRWPGSLLTKSNGIVYVLRLTDGLVRTLIDIEPNMFRWRHDSGHPLPEDLCAFAEGAGRPAMVSVTHECDAWLLTDRAPAFVGVTRCRKQDVDLMVPGGKYFCGGK